MHHNPDDKYLDLLEKTLCFDLWDEPLKPLSVTAQRHLGVAVAKKVDKWLRKRGLALGIVPKHHAREGVDWPALAHTMVGSQRLRNIRQLCRAIEADQIPGSFVECGVWRGGASIYARACLPPHRKVVCCDSFHGLPPDQREPEYYAMDFLRVSKEQVQRNFEAYGLFHNVEFVKGYFSKTLHSVAGPIAILRADGDMYSSTMEILNHLYDKVATNGYVIIDDYCLRPCRDAVHEFRRDRGITDPLIDIDGNAVYWQTKRA